MLIMMIITTTITLIIINGLVKLEPTYNAVIVGLSEYIKQARQRWAHQISARI